MKYRNSVHVMHCLWCMISLYDVVCTANLGATILTLYLYIVLHLA